MNRVVLLATEPVLGQAEAVIELPHAVVATLALELSLLLAGLTDAFRLRANSGASIILTLEGAETAGKARVKYESDDRVCFGLGRNQAEYLYAVLLRAYRDGVAEVNHVPCPMSHVPYGGRC